MRVTADVIVVGLGAAGSAALYQLARRGALAVGIDSFQPPHQHGSSHGDTRITRLALGEGSHYVPLARRSHEIWRELESVSGPTLFRKVGCLIYGSASARNAAHGVADFLSTTIDVARQHGIAHEVLDARALRRRLPQFRFADDDHGCFEPGGGFVDPEACITMQLEQARRLGARTHVNERVTAWDTSASGIEVTTNRATYAADRLILTAGAWLPALLPILANHIRICRQVMFWFLPEGDHARFTAELMPVYVRVADSPGRTFYGFPAIDGPDGGLKIAGEQFERAAAPDEIDPTVSAAEQAAMHALAAPHIHIGAQCVRTAVCMYTVTPDFDFIIDHAPETERVWFASACSGHGFKHSAAVGEALAEIVTTGQTRFDLSRFSLDRLVHR
jgi:sarcosine oxidase